MLKYHTETDVYKNHIWKVTVADKKTYKNEKYIF